MKPLTWRKAKRSTTQGGNCVEMADLGKGNVGVRDSKNPDAGHFTLSPSAYRNLLNRIKSGDLNL